MSISRTTKAGDLREILTTALLEVNWNAKSRLNASLTKRDAVVIFWNGIEDYADDELVSDVIADNIRREFGE